MTNDVLFNVLAGKDRSVGVMILNRPQVLNSLNHDMIVALYKQLKQWETDPNIKAVIIRAAEGRAFCAGGDLRLTYDRACAKNPLMTEFFRDEYQLNRYIHHYPKPYIALLDGITMGGGVGISIHGSHRVATDRLLFAMPETGIGFFPDVGGTYFLPRIPDKLGYYLGLTGMRIKCADSLALGLVQHKVSEADLGSLQQAIADKTFTQDARQSVTDVLNELEMARDVSLLNEKRQLINKHFSRKTMDEIMASLATENDSICVEAVKHLKTKSPTSLKVTLRALQDGEKLDFDTCMRNEYRLTCRFLHGHDFLEGIRAVIIDKDQKPVWQPAQLDQVTHDVVDSYFSPVEEEL